jgi:hypothetical protein
MLDGVQVIVDAMLRAGFGRFYRCLAQSACPPLEVLDLNAVF